MIEDNNMLLVVDANILFAALIKNDVTAELILRKTHRSVKEFEHFLHIIQKYITIINYKEIEPYLDEAKRISPDPKDVPYFALAIKFNCPIWSND